MFVDLEGGGGTGGSGQDEGKRSCLDEYILQQRTKDMTQQPSCCCNERWGQRNRQYGRSNCYSEHTKGSI
ncbi:hypothetical protein DL93DRAFT_1178876 [Clavulina sp. PMI_390]|nr:hypothetical protein DL93DRAFT_1178876 [Clavulina sp. PMI_390]